MAQLQIGELLRSVPYFAGLDAEALGALESLAVERAFDKGELLFMEGGDCPGLYIMKAGLVRIFKTSPEGKEQVLLVARPSDSFNEVPVFDGGPNPANAEAMERTTVYILPKHDLVEMVRHRPDMALRLVKVFAARLRHLTLLVEDLSFRHVTSRLARILLEVAESQAKGGPPAAPADPATDGGHDRHRPRDGGTLAEEPGGGRGYQNRGPPHHRSQGRDAQEAAVMWAVVSLRVRRRRTWQSLAL